MAGFRLRRRGSVCRPRSEMPMFGITNTPRSTMAATSESVDARRHQLLGVIVVEDDVAEAAWYNAGWPFPTCPVSRNAAC